MHILFDEMSTQVQVQNETCARLNTLWGAITAKGWTYAQISNPITPEQLSSCDVLCILTRLQSTQPGFTNPFPPNTIFAYLPSEIDAILQFVNAGGGLLFISNHGPFDNPKQLADDQTRYDRALANMLGVFIQPATFQYPPPKPLTLSGALLSTDPSLTSTVLNGVGSIVIHNSCAISALPGTTLTPIASIPSDVGNVSPLCPNPVPGDFVYAGALAYGGGNVIVAGNSGIVGDATSGYPAQGMIDEGDNKTFIVNCLSYLAPAPPNAAASRIAGVRVAAV
jgi:hypothetical protein